MNNTITRLAVGWLKECEHCGKRYESIREDSKYCEAKCRQQSRRQRLAAIGTVNDYAIAGDATREAYKAGHLDETTLKNLRYEYRRMKNFLSFYGLLSETEEAEHTDK